MLRLVSPKDQEEYAAALEKLTAGLGNPDLIERRTCLLKALADEARLKMLRLLSARELCVCELTVALDLTQPTASHHLNILKNVEPLMEVPLMLSLVRFGLKTNRFFPRSKRRDMREIIAAKKGFQLG